MDRRKIWLIRHSETLPCDGESPRLLRMGLLAEELRKGENDITWWTSTLLYNNKAMRFDHDAVVDIDENYRIRFVHSGTYEKNISIKRLVHYANARKKFLYLAELEEEPDIIVASMPSIEWALAAVEYATKHNVPIFVDIRDTFPDMYLDYFSEILRPLVNIGITPYRRQLSKALQGATGLFASSDQYLEWALAYAQRERSPIDRIYHIAYPDTKNEYGKEDLAKWLDMGLTENDFICCFFGQFGHTVDIDTIVEASQLFDSSSRVKFVVCGVGEKREAYVKATASQKNILFPGWVNQREISALCSISSAGLMAYRPAKNYEMSMPNKFGEYLALGQAILLQPRGIMVDYVQKEGCGLMYHDADTLKRAIDKMESDPQLLRSMKSRARALYEKEFCAETVYREEADYIELNSRKKMHIHEV